MSKEDEEQEEYFTRMRKGGSYWGRRPRHPAGMRYKRARNQDELRTGWAGPLAVVGFLCLVFLVVWLLAR